MVVERLHKAMARAGVASRRACEVMIAAGRVTVDGVRITMPGVVIDTERHLVQVDGRPLPRALDWPARSVALAKPPGVVSTVDDPRGRPTVVNLVQADFPGSRLYPVGRLDYDSEGLMVLTNDGELTYRLTHPRYGVEKEYVVAVQTVPTDQQLHELSTGIPLDSVMTAPAIFERIASWNGLPAVRVVLHEGRNRQIRRMFAWEGIAVARLLRVRFGPVHLGRLRPGSWRRLDPAEVRALEASVGLSHR